MAELSSVEKSYLIVSIHVQTHGMTLSSSDCMFNLFGYSVERKNDQKSVCVCVCAAVFGRTQECGWSWNRNSISTLVALTQIHFVSRALPLIHHWENGDNRFFQLSYLVVWWEGRVQI